jgi:hypothetical protein
LFDTAGTPKASPDLSHSLGSRLHNSTCLKDFSLYQ